MSTADQSRARGLMAARLGARTGIDESWIDAFASVRREDFIPDQVWINKSNHPVPIDSRADSEAWWSHVYDEERSIVIQLDDGADDGPGDYSSSSTMPLVMARMLAMMPGTGRVLEIGTGSGYNAAVMAHRYGAENIVSADVDTRIAEQAAESTSAAGYPVKVVVGDGVTGEGIPDGPYDGIIATCSFRKLPKLWLELCPNGRIVTPWFTRWSDVACIKLDTKGGAAEGRFVHGIVFMKARGHRLPSDRPQKTDGGTERVSQLDPEQTSWRYSFAAFAVGLLAPGIDYYQDDDTQRYTVWDGLGSWAVIDGNPGPDGWQVREHGPRKLWQVVERVYKRWQGWDAPGPDRFGVSISNGNGVVWLDNPATPVATLPIG